MECPACKSYFTLKEFCMEMNPFKVKCPECGARLKYANFKQMIKPIVLAALAIFAVGYAISLLILPPKDTVFLIWVGVGCCVYGFYLVYKKAVFVEAPEPEGEKED